MRFIFFFLLLLNPSMALSSGTITETEEFEVYEDFDINDHVDDTEFLDADLLDGHYPGGGQGNFRCQIIVIVVDFNNRNRRSRHSFWGSGNSWGNSRGSAWRQYGNWIGRGNFWHSRYSHNFYFDRCF